MNTLAFPRLAFLWFAVCSCGLAWDYPGHRAVNQLALEALPPEFPKFIQTPEARERIAFLAGEPDRWRNTEERSFAHAVFPDHQIDLESLIEVGYTPETLPVFRNDYIGHCLIVRQQHPERFAPIDPDKNKDHTREYIGTLPWTIVEHYAKLRSAFSYLRAFEEHGGTREEIENAKANIIYIMGVMGHYVGDAGQPLHTTKYYNGWFGENPNGYTTARTLHTLIDGAFLKKTGELDIHRLATEIRPAQFVSTAPDAAGRDGIFTTVLAFIVEQNQKVETLYQFEKAGKFTPENPASKEGRALLEAQIVKSGHLLSCLWLTAWHNTPPDKFLISRLAERQLK